MNSDIDLCMTWGWLTQKCDSINMIYDLEIYQMIC